VCKISSIGCPAGTPDAARFEQRRLPGQIVKVRTAKAQPSIPAARLVACHGQQQSMQPGQGRIALRGTHEGH